MKTSKSIPLFSIVAPSFNDAIQRTKCFHRLLSQYAIEQIRDNPASTTLGFRHPTDQNAKAQNFNHLHTSSSCGRCPDVYNPSCMSLIMTITTLFDSNPQPSDLLIENLRTSPNTHNIQVASDPQANKQFHEKENSKHASRWGQKAYPRPEPTPDPRSSLLPMHAMCVFGRKFLADISQEVLTVSPIEFESRQSRLRRARREKEQSYPGKPSQQELYSKSHRSQDRAGKKRTRGSSGNSIVERLDQPEKPWSLVGFMNFATVVGVDFLSIFPPAHDARGEQQNNTDSPTFFAKG